MKALKVLYGKRVADAKRGSARPELRFCDGVIEVATPVEDGFDVLTIGINDIIEDAILDFYTIEDGVVELHYLNRAMEEKVAEFELDKGSKRGTKHILEEVRKGKRSVVITSMDRKTKLFKRLRKGYKAL